MTAAPAGFSDPGAWAPLLDAFGRAPGEIAAALQGVLIHDAFGARLYGTPPDAFFDAPRATRPVAERLAQVGTAAARPPFDRTVATCRDFALLTTAALRRAGHEARVRGGFADYLTPPPEPGEARWYEDHWLCEYRPAPGAPWRLVDAQLDGAHRRALPITFAIDAVPRDRFLTADTAWREARAGRIDPARVGHGKEAAGLWFLAVNLHRDRLARFERIVSDWDDWRAVPPGERFLSDAVMARCDALARDRRLAANAIPIWRGGER